MLVNFNEMLSLAKRDGYAIGSFNAYNYETIRGIIDAGSQAGSAGTIVAFGKKYLENISLEDAVAITSALAARTDMPVCLHLDHCDDIDVIRKAIAAGFTSVMYDGSALPFAQNAANTRLVCDMAHAAGVSVEAELGSLASGEHSHEGSVTDREIYTDPDQAARFIAETGVDALAVSVGTVHGLYKGKPNIRVDILRAINEKAGIPLVLHGGSGIPEETITDCIHNGICKINVNTEISVYAVEKTAQALCGGERPHLSVIAKWQQQYVSEVVTKYIAFFRHQAQA